MKQKITGFHRDEENHWVAELGFGHGQHMRHDPPWMEREWVVSKEGRDSRLGAELNCVRCDELGKAVAAAVLRQCREAMMKAYELGGMSGLCAEGRWELALDSLTAIDLNSVAEAGLHDAEAEKARREV